MYALAIHVYTCTCIICSKGYYIPQASGSREINSSQACVHVCLHIYTSWLWFIYNIYTCIYTCTCICVYNYTMYLLSHLFFTDILHVSLDLSHLSSQQAAHTAVVVKQQPVVSVTATAFRDYPVTVTDSNGQQVQCTIILYMYVILCIILLESR